MGKFCLTPRNSVIIFCPGQGIRKIARVAGIRSLKKIFRGLPGGMYPVGIDWGIRLGTTTSLFHHLARLFTFSIQIGCIPLYWKLATLRMLLEPDKLSSLTTTYKLISLMSPIMKLFERVIEQRLRSCLEDIGFRNKYQSTFRQNKSADDHLFRLFQSVMKIVNRGEHAVAAFLDAGKAFDNVWHSGLRYKIFMLDLPTKMTRRLSDFPVGRVIQVNINGFLSDKISPIAGGFIGFCPESITFPDIRQWLTKTSPLIKVEIPVRWWHCSMGC